MKITKYVCVDTDLEIDLTVADITQILDEARQQLDETPEPNRRDVMWPLSAVFVTLKGYSDDLIAKLTDADKQIVYPELAAQIERFRPAVPAVKPGIGD